MSPENTANVLVITLSTVSGVVKSAGPVVGLLVQSLVSLIASCMTLGESVLVSLIFLTVKWSVP